MSSKTSHAENLDVDRLPGHVAIIMDGNGRWAKKRLMNRVRGHEKGVDTVRTIVKACRELNIPALTLYAFSTENWQRPTSEVNALMGLLKRFLTEEEPELVKNRIRFTTIGQLHRLPNDVQATILRVRDATAENDGLNLNLALSYGGRTEITEMVKAVSSKVKTGELALGDIDESVVADHLYTHHMADPDLMIRTSGEMRISNFLLWQLAYSELYVTKTLWPDFTKEEFITILQEYQLRDRRFGKVKQH